MPKPGLVLCVGNPHFPTRLSRLMKNQVKILGLALGFSLAAAAPARAQFDNTCSMGAFTICASVRLQSTGNTLTMQVWNLHGLMGDYHTMTSIGLYHSGSEFDWNGRVSSYSVTHDGNNITNAWTQKNANDIQNLGGVKLELREGTSGNRGIVGCFDPGGAEKWATCRSFSNQPYVEFTFNLTQHFALDNVELRWHSQQLPDGSSIKCDTGGNGDYPDCIEKPPTTTVPEPATMVLMGTGLISLAGVAKRRRRKTEEAEA